MSINWSSVKNELINYFEKYRANSESNAAQKITNLYYDAIMNGTNMWNNRPIAVNKSVLLQGLISGLTGMRALMSGSSNTILNTSLTTGLIGFWAGGTLSLGPPPPGSVAIVSNAVLNPGSPQINIPNNNRSASIMANALVNAFRQHLITVSGLTIAMVPQPTGPPIPVSFPWSGIK